MTSSEARDIRMRMKGVFREPFQRVPAAGSGISGKGALMNTAWEAPRTDMSRPPRMDRGYAYAPISPRIKRSRAAPAIPAAVATATWRTLVSAAAEGAKSGKNISRESVSLTTGITQPLLQDTMTGRFPGTGHSYFDLPIPYIQVRSLCSP